MNQRLAGEESFVGEAEEIVQVRELSVTENGIAKDSGEERESEWSIALAEDFREVCRKSTDDGCISEGLRRGWGA